MEMGAPRWGRDFDPDRLAAIELEAWKAYYRREGPRLFRLLIRANREQAGVDTGFGRSSPRSGSPGPRPGLAD
jgi:hypothetical protein